VDLPEPDAPDEEDELALGDLDVGVAQGDDVALVDLGDVLELDHGTLDGEGTSTSLRPIEHRRTGQVTAMHRPGRGAVTRAPRLRPVRRAARARASAGRPP
jgi:hypothetical protein